MTIKAWNKLKVRQWIKDNAAKIEGYVFNSFARTFTQESKSSYQTTVECGAPKNYTLQTSLNFLPNFHHCQTGPSFIRQYPARSYPNLSFHLYGEDVTGKFLSWAIDDGHVQDVFNITPEELRLAEIAFPPKDQRSSSYAMYLYNCNLRDSNIPVDRIKTQVVDNMGTPHSCYRPIGGSTWNGNLTFHWLINGENAGDHSPYGWGNGPIYDWAKGSKINPDNLKDGEWQYIKYGFQFYDGTPDSIVPLYRVRNIFKDVKAFDSADNQTLAKMTLLPKQSKLAA